MTTGTKLSSALGFQIPGIQYSVPEPTTYTGIHVIRLNLPVNYFSKQLAPDYALLCYADTMVTISLPAAQPFTNGLTYEIWLRGRGAILYNPFLININDQDRVVLSLSGQTVTSSPIDPNQWHHVAASLSPANKITLYVDGNAVGHIEVEGIKLPQRAIVLCADAVLGGAFHGVVDEFRLWRSERSPEDIRNHMSISVGGEDDLLCYLRFNEGQGQTTRDYSGNNLDGAISNGQWGASTRPLRDTGGDSIPGPHLTAGNLTTAYKQAKEQGVFDPLFFPTLGWINTAEARHAAQQALPETDRFLDVFISKYQAGEQLTLYRTTGGQLNYRFIDTQVGDTQPALYLLERYRLSSYLGGYGAGRVVGTFSLLPGEKTTISLSSYRASKETRVSASSILDSYTEESAQEFQSALESEWASGSTAASRSSYQKDSSTSASMEASVEASWGFGSAQVSGSLSGTDSSSKTSATESSREEFAKNVSNATSKHAATASAKREVSVSASSEKTVEQQDTQDVIREIENVNSSHTLNFVFRQMNQEFYTLLQLIDVRIAASGYAPVSLAEMDGLLAKVLKEEQRSAVRGAIENELSGIRDYQGNPHADFITRSSPPAGDPQAPQAEGEYPLKVQRDYISNYHDPINQFHVAVPGVIVNAQKNVMRTDGVMVEAFLGQGIALDDHALELQAAEAETRRLDNQIKAAQLKILLDGDNQRAGLFQKLFAGSRVYENGNGDG
ncbi:MAG: LamG domain-containing protein [Anaerolineaceae bacterium]|nr:LamG domain-containing protein [Anaerolineaceae bacterium]